MRFTLVSKSDQISRAGKPIFLIWTYSRVQKNDITVALSA